MTARIAAKSKNNAPETLRVRLATGEMEQLRKIAAEDGHASVGAMVRTAFGLPAAVRGRPWPKPKKK